jgi:hypothetical protein
MAASYILLIVICAGQEGTFLARDMSVSIVFLHEEAIVLPVSKYTLQAASYEGHGRIVELLLGKDADVNAQGGKYGNALQAASSEGHDRIVDSSTSRYHGRRYLGISFPPIPKISGNEKMAHSRPNQPISTHHGIQKGPFLGVLTIRPSQLVG